MRDYAGSAILMAITTLVGIGCYTAAAHGAADRDAILQMKRQLIADGRAIRDLEAELRTRARLPQLERWNDEVLKMSAPAATQFMRSPVQLASLINPEKPADGEAGPTLRYAITPATPAAPAAGPTAAVVQVRTTINEDSAPARLVLSTYATPATAPIEADAAVGAP